jgi:hypothetical protein
LVGVSLRWRSSLTKSRLRWLILVADMVCAKRTWRLCWPAISRWWRITCDYRIAFLLRRLNVWRAVGRTRGWICWSWRVLSVAWLLSILIGCLLVKSRLVMGIWLRWIRWSTGHWAVP